MNKVIIDVREPAEFNSGHVEGAINVPLSGFHQVPQAISGIPKDDEVILYCQSGNRSNQAMMLLRSWGFTNVTNGINRQNVESSLA